MSEPEPVKDRDALPVGIGILVLLSIVCLGVGVGCLISVVAAVAGYGLIGAAGVFAIWARVAQAGFQQDPRRTSQTATEAHSDHQWAAREADRRAEANSDRVWALTDGKFDDAGL
jgi:hypothetical protein